MVRDTLVEVQDGDYADPTTGHAALIRPIIFKSRWYHFRYFSSLLMNHVYETIGGRLIRGSVHFNRFPILKVVRTT